MLVASRVVLSSTELVSRTNAYFEMSGTVELLCPRVSDYAVSQRSVQFFVGIKTFTKTRLRWDVMYSFEDLLGRSVTRLSPLSVIQY
jgi:hypothetical protein